MIIDCYDIETESIISLTTYLNTTKQLVGAIALGYADEKPAQRPRKPIEEIVEYRL